MTTIINYVRRIAQPLDEKGSQNYVETNPQIFAFGNRVFLMQTARFPIV